MAKFDLGDFAKTMQAVPDSGTTEPERIEYIPLEQLHEDERNFYAVSGVEDLAANIQFCGLMDPLRVRKAEEGYTIVSGHRRFAALKLLAAEDAKFEKAACIIDTGDVPAALQELRLIYANSDTRRMSPADIGKQAERVEALLYELKEQGMEFPGRMRDHVAEACKVSKSKLSRLAVIRNRLAPDILKAYWDGPEKGRLRESTAYELARLSVNLQRQLVDRYRCGNASSPGLCWMSSRIPENVAEYTKGFAKLRCSQTGEACSHRAGKEAHVVAALVKDCWARPNCNHLCCADCPVIASCRDICPKCKEKQRQAKAENKETRLREKTNREKMEKPAVDAIKAIWLRFGALRERSGLSPDEYIREIDCPYYIEPRPGKFEEFETGTAKFTPGTELPFGYHVSLSDVHRWCAAAKALGCSVDYLMMRTNEPRTAEEIGSPMPEPGQLTLGCWMPGGTNPAHSCECLTILDVSAAGAMKQTLRQTAYWVGGAFRLKNNPYADELGFPVLAWLEIPKWEGGKTND